MGNEATLLVNGVDPGDATHPCKITFVGKSFSVYVPPGEYFAPNGTTHLWARWTEPKPVKLTLADAVRMQNVLWHSFVTWYATGEVTGKMFAAEYRYVGPDVVTYTKW